MGHLRQADHLQQFIGASAARAMVQAEELAVVVEGFARVEEAIQIRLFGQEPDVPLD